MRARGINDRIARAWGNRKFSGIGNRATLTTSLAGANNDITLFAKTPGTSGNSVRLALVVAGASTPLTVSVSTNDITVNVATSAGSAAISTAAEVVNAIRFNLSAKALVHAQLAPANDGTGVVTALAFTNLAGAV
jgi:hypothetical protein